jgi:6-pyruvoyltetrahydropterin/6-carboxytetrahydropterin synthase
MAAGLLGYESVPEERAMHQIEAEFTFAAAHRLPRYNGKCFNLHGHNYRFQIAVRGEPDPYSGMLIDFVDVEKAVKDQVLDKVDHTNLNDFIENPTAENIAVWIWHRLEGKLRGLAEVRLWEVPTSCVVYRGPAGKW